MHAHAHSLFPHAHSLSHTKTSTHVNTKHRDMCASPPSLSGLSGHVFFYQKHNTHGPSHTSNPCPRHTTPPIQARPLPLRHVNTQPPASSDTQHFSNNLFIAQALFRHRHTSPTTSTSFEHFLMHAFFLSHVPSFTRHTPLSAAPAVGTNLMHLMGPRVACWVNTSGTGSSWGGGIFPFHTKWGRQDPTPFPSGTF